MQVGTCWWNLAVCSSVWLFVHSNRNDYFHFTNVALHLFITYYFVHLTILINDWPIIFIFYRTEVDSTSRRTSPFRWYWCWWLASSLYGPSWTVYILLSFIHRFLSIFPFFLTFWFIANWYVIVMKVASRFLCRAVVLAICQGN
jgi:hypothetical protein